MFPCCCVPRIGRKDNNETIIDIESVLQDFVWADFLNSLGSFHQKFVKRQNYEVEVPMNYFHIEEYKKPKMTPRVKRPDGGESNGYGGYISKEINRNKPNATTTKTTKKKRKNCPTDSNKCELVTNYVNDTDTAQTYKFRLEKTRKSTLTVTVQKGFTVGGKTNFTLGLPKLAGGPKVGGEFDMRFNVSKTNNDVIEETVTFETTSDIHVKENSKYVARVVLLETEVSYDFRAWTKLSLPSGGAPTCVRRKHDKALCHQYVIERLDKVFDNHKKHVKIMTQSSRPIHHSQDPTKMRPEEQNFITYFVVIESRGIVDGVRLSDQEISLKAESLLDKAASSDNSNGVEDNDEETDKDSDDSQDDDENDNGHNMVVVGVREGSLPQSCDNNSASKVKRSGSTLSSVSSTTKPQVAPHVSTPV